MELLPLVFATGWASGVNASVTVVVLGLLGRFAEVDPVPAAFQRTDVLIVMAVLAAIELVVDKFCPWDSLLDVVGTLARPVAGGFIGALIGSSYGTGSAIGMGVVGVVAALLTHLVKMAFRLATTRPSQPAGTIALSVAEDVAVVVAVTCAFLVPGVTAVVAAALVVLGAATSFVLRGRIKDSLQRLRHLARRTQQLRPPKKPPLVERIRRGRRG